MQTVIINLRALTPLWTGGYKKQKGMDKINPSNILGWLRYWAEAIERIYNPELKSEPCKITDDDIDRLELIDDVELTNKTLGELGLCNICYVYGTTGWAKRFYMDISAGNGKMLNFDNKLIPSGREHKNRSGGWPLKGGYIGEFNITISYLEEETSILPYIIIPVKIISKFASFGGNTSNGNGAVCKVENNNNFFDRAIIEKFFSDNRKIDYSNKSQMPNLLDMFFIRVRFHARFDMLVNLIKKQCNNKVIRDDNKVNKNDLKECFENGFFPIAPLIKNYLRYEAFRLVPKLDENIFGVVKDNGKTRIKSKINISHAYRIDNNDKWELRIWGWLPCNIDGVKGYKRQELIGELCDDVNKYFDELNLAVDTVIVEPRSDFDSFLQKLLE